MLSSAISYAASKKKKKKNGGQREGEAVGEKRSENREEP